MEPPMEQLTQNEEGLVVHDVKTLDKRGKKMGRESHCKKHPVTATKEERTKAHKVEMLKRRHRQLSRKGYWVY